MSILWIGVKLIFFSVLFYIFNSFEIYKKNFNVYLDLLFMCFSVCMCLFVKLNVINEEEFIR